MLPLLIADAALKIGGTLLSAHAQNKAANANRAAAITDENSQLNQLTLRSRQESQAAVQSDQLADRQTQMDAGIQNVSAAENGVTGNSVNALMGELQYQKGMYHDSVAENLHNQLLQLDQSKLGVVARTDQRIASGPQKANPWATALKIGGDALQAFTQFKAGQPAVGDSAGTPSPDIAPVLTPNNAGNLGSSPLTPIAAPFPSMNLKLNVNNG